jgi:hypothetical protein
MFSYNPPANVRQDATDGGSADEILVYCIMRHAVASEKTKYFSSQNDPTGNSCQVE